jgi:uncharacterized protein (DUF2147 family)
MQQSSFFGKAVLSVLVLFSALVANAQAEGKWFNQEKSAHIEIYKGVGGKLAGRIVWLKEPNDEAGKPKTDPLNPNEKLRSRSRLGMVVLSGLKASSTANYWDGGTIYDPKSGKTYSLNMTAMPDGTLKLRGYMGVSLLGKTQVWTKAN